ncbi:uncharacterized protein LOC102804102 [Saccoglossus kowalevskii]|uniref:Uncharacterized protein LOC102804102 n=1 Tax=Saccoglossus kowalevskii TaxID=10224 RepID=A0ABM0MNQ8_SACKO|nr:PREDICTED: uncharacterized protein LOC102804102 [Saccoglossus kowalevskii]
MAEPGKLDLDSALHELGMLSAVTNSRKEYLKEKESKNDTCKTSKHGFTVVQMNSAFVTRLQPVKSLPTSWKSLTDIPSHKFDEETDKSRRASYPLPTGSDFYISHHRVAKMHRSRVRFRKPYTVPKKRACIRRCSESDEVITSKVDNGNQGEGKEKIKFAKRPVRKIKRSKSLDDLCLTKLHIDENGTTQRKDIEKIALNLMNLTVS